MPADFDWPVVTRIPGVMPARSSGFPAPSTTSRGRRSNRPTWRRIAGSATFARSARLKDGVTIEQARIEAQAIAGRLGAAVSGRRWRARRDVRRARRAVHRQPAAADGGAARRGRLRAGDRLREHRQPAARPRRGAPQGNRRPRRPRRHPRPRRPPAADRVDGARLRERGGRRRSWRGGRCGGWCGQPGQPAGHRRGGARRARAAVHRGGCHSSPACCAACCRRCTPASGRINAEPRRDERPRRRKAGAPAGPGMRWSPSRLPWPWFCSSARACCCAASIPCRGSIPEYAPTNLLTFDMFLSGERAQRQPLAARVLRRCAAGESRRCLAWSMRGAAVTLPIGGDAFAAPVSIEGAPAAAPGEEAARRISDRDAGIFPDALASALVSGRDFARVGRCRGGAGRAGERDIRPAALARIRIRSAGGCASAGGAGDWMTVVGLVSDIRHLGPATPPRPEFYRPHSQLSFSFMAFVVRTQGAPEAAGAGDPRGHHQPRSRAADVGRQHDGAASRDRAGAAEVHVDAGGMLRRAGAAPEHGRRLRRDGVLGDAAHARDRHPHRARRIEPQRARRW